MEREIDSHGGSHGSAGVYLARLERALSARAPAGSPRARRALVPDIKNPPPVDSRALSAIG
jgi:hypothetical protein